MRIKIGKFEFEGTKEEFSFLLDKCPELLGLLRKRLKTTAKAT